MPRPRTEFPLNHDVAIETMADIVAMVQGLELAETVTDTKAWAARLVGHLARRRVFLRYQPETVTTVSGAQPQGPVVRQSSSKERAIARDAWTETLRSTRSPVRALAATVETTMGMHPSWTLGDAIDHTVAFILPDDMQRGSLRTRYVKPLKPDGDP